MKLTKLSKDRYGCPMDPLIIAAILIPLGVLMLIVAYKSGPPAVDESSEDDDILDESQEEANETNVPTITSLTAPPTPPTMMMSTVRPAPVKPAEKPAAVKPKKGDSAFVPALRDAVKQASAANRSVGKLSPIGR